MGSTSSKLVTAVLAAGSLALFPAGAVARPDTSPAKPVNDLRAEQRAVQASVAAQRTDNSLQAEERAVEAGAAAQRPRSVAAVDLRSPDARDAAAGRTVGAAGQVAQSSPPVGSGSSGFDWGDAGIGAGGTIGLLLLGLGGTAIVSHRRPSERSGRSTLAS
jgi:hypothetical protein